MRATWADRAGLGYRTLRPTRRPPNIQEDRLARPLSRQTSLRFSNLQEIARMRASLAVIGSFFVFAWSATAPATAADWPQWRGPHRDGISPDHSLLQAWPAKGPELVWSSKN